MNSGRFSFTELWVRREEETARAATRRACELRKMFDSATVVGLQVESTVDWIEGDGDNGARNEGGGNRR